MRQLIKRWPRRSTDAREEKKGEKYARIRSSRGTALFGGPLRSMYGAQGPSSPHSPWRGRGPPRRTLYARPFTSYGSSRGTEPRQGETVPVDMFIISTSKPLLRFSGLDMAPSVPHPSVRAPLQANKIRGTKGPANKLRGTRPTARTFSLSRGTKTVPASPITVLLRRCLWVSPSITPASANSADVPWIELQSRSNARLGITSAKTTKLPAGFYGISHQAR